MCFEKYAEKLKMAEDRNESAIVLGCSSFSIFQRKSKFSKED